MSTLRHPKMVQFLGLCTLPDSPMPVILMDRLLMSLLESCRPNPMSLILHNVASGLAFLHEQSSPIIHSDLTASNVLLNSGMVAKVADLGIYRSHLAKWNDCSHNDQSSRKCVLYASRGLFPQDR